MRRKAFGVGGKPRHGVKRYFWALLATRTRTTSALRHQDARRHRGSQAIYGDEAHLPKRNVQCIVPHSDGAVCWLEYQK